MNALYVILACSLSVSLTAMHTSMRNETLLNAARTGDLEKVKSALADHADVNATTEDLLETPLFLAAAYGRTQIVALLLAHGADVNSQDRDGNTPLLIAANHAYYDIAEQLLSHGANPNALNNVGESSLFYAVESSSYDLAKLLMFYGADVNLSNDEQWTLLHRAASKKDVDMMEWLIIHGAKITEQAKKSLQLKPYESYPLLRAIINNETEEAHETIGTYLSVEKLSSRQIFELNRALPLAVALGQEDVAKAMVISFSKDISQRSLEKALIAAIANNRLILFTIIYDQLRKIVTVEQFATILETALQQAAIRQRMNIVNFILEHEPTPNIQRVGRLLTSFLRGQSHLTEQEQDQLADIRESLRSITRLRQASGHQFPLERLAQWAPQLPQEILALVLSYVLHAPTKK